MRICAYLEERELREEGMARTRDVPGLAADWCDDCGARHSPERRRAILRRVLPATAKEIRDGELEHFWPRTLDVSRGDSCDAGTKMLNRDLRAIGAVPVEAGAQSGPVWTLDGDIFGGWRGRFRNPLLQAGLHRRDLGMVRVGRRRGSP